MYSTPILLMHAQPAITIMHIYVHCYPLTDIAAQRPRLLHEDRANVTKEAVLVEVGPMEGHTETCPTLSSESRLALLE